jgi:hypothetical protein
MMIAAIPATTAISAIVSTRRCALAFFFTWSGLSGQRPSRRRSPSQSCRRSIAWILSTVSSTS